MTETTPNQDRPDPDFLIVGAMKAGTSTLGRYLAQHPQVHCAPREIHYFSRADLHGRGPGWYRDQLHAENPGGARIVGEKSASYHHIAEAPSRIAAFNPDMRAIWLFRDPVARAVSHYWHAVRRGSEPLPFAKAVATRRGAQSGTDFRDYLDRSRYATQLARYLAHLPRENQLFVVFEEFIAEPLTTVNRALDFIGAAPMEALAEERHDNKSVYYAPARLYYMAQRLPVGRKTKRRLIRPLRRANKPAEPAGLRAALWRELEPEVAQLEDILGRELNIWREKHKGG